MQLGYSTTLHIDFDEAVERTKAALAEQGFGVLTEIDEESVNAHILESAKRLWGRLNHRAY